MAPKGWVNSNIKDGTSERLKRVVQGTMGEQIDLLLDLWEAAPQSVRNYCILMKATGQPVDPKKVECDTTKSQ